MAKCSMPDNYDCNLDNAPCVPQEMTINNVRLAAAYVPFQFLCQLYSPIDSLRLGTAFPELFSPYDPWQRQYCR